LKKIRQRFERFCLRNRDKGISNLMLYICLGSGIVTFAGMLNGGDLLYQILCFDKAAILRGQVWRLFSWLLTEQLGGGLLSLLFLYFFYRLGNAVERSIGTFKFNLFYLAGVVIMDLFAMAFCPTEQVLIDNMLIPPEAFTYFYGNMAYYLHLSMVLAFATMYPDSQFMIFFIIPVRAWVIALFDLILIGINVFNMCVPTLFFPHCLFPLMGLLNYFIFFGADMSNLLPLSWRAKLRRNRGKQAGNARVIHFTPAQRQESPKPNYTHRCTVCGRTDVTNPELEFRYCSRCNGYHCYCQDHINNHTHVE
jgi:hypothetical protein